MTTVPTSPAASQQAAEVATALAALTGEPHPLAPEGPGVDVNHA
jgi:hypothetical protein